VYSRLLPKSDRTLSETSARLKPGLSWAIYTDPHAAYATEVLPVGYFGWDLFVAGACGRGVRISRYSYSDAD